MGHSKVYLNNNVLSLSMYQGQLEDEQRQKSKFQAECRNLQGDVDSLKDSLEQEQEAASDMQRAVKKAQDEASMWKAKFDSGEEI